MATHKSCRSRDFTVAAIQELNAFTDEAREAMDDAIEESAKFGRTQVRKNAQQLYGSGKYSRGWQYELERKRLRTSAKIYNGGKHMPLGHLLEHGHIMVNGQRWEPKKQHILPVADEVEDKLVRELEARI